MNIDYIIGLTIGVIIGFNWGFIFGIKKMKLDRERIENGKTNTMLGF